jgi:hypothetical protein
MAATEGADGQHGQSNADPKQDAHSEISHVFVCAVAIDF